MSKSAPHDWNTNPYHPLIMAGTVSAAFWWQFWTCPWIAPPALFHGGSSDDEDA